MKKINPRTLENRYFKICTYLNVHEAMGKYLFSYSDIFDSYYVAINCLNRETNEIKTEIVSLLIGVTKKRIKEIQDKFDIKYEWGEEA